MRRLVVVGNGMAGARTVEEVLKRALKEPLPQIFVLQGEIPKETTFAILKAIPEAAKRAGHIVETIFNPAPVYQEGIPVDCLGCVTHLVVNETEMGQLAVDAGSRYAAASTEPEKRAALDVAAVAFHRMSVRNVVITRGAKGIFCSTHSGSFHLDAARVAKVADTTAAGDTFVGYYAAELARQTENSKRLATGKTLTEACRLATLSAAKCVERQGAIESIPWGYEIGE